MSEYKQYITEAQENGNVMISEDVIETIVDQALTEVEGLERLNIKTGAEIVDLIGGKNWGKGIKVQIGENDELVIECNIIVKFDYAVVDVAKNCQSAVANAVESVTGVHVDAVNVNVCGIVRQ